MFCCSLFKHLCLHCVCGLSIAIAFDVFIVSGRANIVVDRRFLTSVSLFTRHSFLPISWKAFHFICSTNWAKPKNRSDCILIISFVFHLEFRLAFLLSLVGFPKPISTLYQSLSLHGCCIDLSIFSVPLLICYRSKYSINFIHISIITVCLSELNTLSRSWYGVAINHRFYINFNR